MARIPAPTRGVIAQGNHSHKSFATVSPTSRNGTLLMYFVRVGGKVGGGDKRSDQSNLHIISDKAEITEISLVSY